MTTRLFIGGLNYRTNEDQLAQYIAMVAPIAVKKNREGMDIIDRNGDPVPAVTIVRDRTFDPPRSKGFGFVEMADEDGAQKVIDQLNGRDFEGRALRINEAQPRQPREGDAPAHQAPRAAAPVEEAPEAVEPMTEEAGE
jgi:RNA recognition motif-containing protein